MVFIIDGKFTFEAAYGKAEAFTIAKEIAKVMSYDYLFQIK